MRNGNFLMLRPVLREIEETIGKLPAEQGGALGGNRETGLVTHFWFDRSARKTGGSYSPDHESLNKLLAECWNPAGVNLLGFVHSHPPSFRRPSGGDEVYARRILDHIPEMDQLLLPIVITLPDSGRFEMFPHAAVRQGDDIQILELDISVIDRESGQHIRQMDVPADVRVFSDNGMDFEETFRRVKGAYDLERLNSCRMIYAGVGGAASFAEDMARAGVGEHILIDYDRVSETNLATQQVYRRDLDRAKVACVAERIRDINPCSVTVACQVRLEDIDDSKITELAKSPLRGAAPALTLLCGLTDDFGTQARVNRLALNLGLPSLCAQVYQEGRGAEITFTYPGVTPACHRCALRSRYEAYLNQRFSNNVTSDGTPIFATTRLNALKGFLAMAILHHGTKHHRWGKLLERIGNRNLIQIRMDPDLGLNVFDRVFGSADKERILFDDVVWLPQEPDCPKNGFPECPDCGGSGDLWTAKGTFVDTLKMRE